MNFFWLNVWNKTSTNEIDYTSNFTKHMWMKIDDTNEEYHRHPTMDEKIFSWIETWRLHEVGTKDDHHLQWN
jgi:hypothetical protein